MSKFEKKFGKYAISNLSLILIMCYVVGYIIQLINRDFMLMLTLDPYAILHGQVWRLVTWIVIPPSSLDIFTVIMLYFYYSVGRTLERTWGDYRYNVYLLSGMLFTVIASFVCMGICYLNYGEVFEVFAELPEMQGAAPFQETLFRLGSTMFSTYYINMSILLAFAATFPNVQVLLMFVVPVKMKWMGIVYGVLLTLQLITGITVSTNKLTNDVCNLFYRGAIAASLLTFAVFWITTKNKIHMTPKQMKHRHEFKQEVKANSRITKHKCAICGQSDESNPNLEFRFCSKCNGNYEYCQEHLFTHEHVK